MPIILDGTAGIDNNATDLSYTGTLTGGTGVVNLGSGQVYKDASGNVGIGTSSPVSLLDVHSSGNTTLTISGSSGGGSDVSEIDFLRIGSGVTSTVKAIRDGANDSGALTFYTATLGTNTERMRIDSSGNMLLGTTSATGSARLVVSGNQSGALSGTRNALYMRNTNSSGNQSNFIVFGSAGTASSCFIGNDIAANGSNISRLDVQAGGSGGVFLGSGATSWASASDERLKTTLIPFENAAEKVSTFRVGTGRYLSDAEDVSRSFLIAQDVQAVLPEAVDVQTDEQGTLGLRYTDVIPLLVAAIKELKAINDAQAQTIESLTARVVALEGA